MAFKNITTAKRTGIIASVETYEIYGEDELGYPELATEHDEVLFVTKTGVLRRMTPKGNKKVNDQQAKKLCGYTGFEILANIYRMQTLKEKGVELRHNIDSVEYEVQINFDIEVFCTENPYDEEFGEYIVTDLDLQRARDLVMKENGLADLFELDAYYKRLNKHCFI